jgi:hypothetical protein
MAEKRSVYLSDRALSLPRIGESLSGRLNQVADRYAELIRRERDSVRALFTAAEWQILCDACADWRPDPASVIPGGAALCVADAARDGVNVGALKEKLFELTPARCFVLCELIEEGRENGRCLRLMGAAESRRDPL